MVNIYILEKSIKGDGCKLLIMGLQCILNLVSIILTMTLTIDEKWGKRKRKEKKN